MAGDAVWIDVLPSLSGFAKELTSGASKAGQDAGKASGSAWSRAFSQTAGDGGSKKLASEMEAAETRAKKAVNDATTEIGKARAAQREATARVITAEESLRDTIAKHGEDSSRAAAATLRLEAARDKQKISNDRLERAEIGLKAAHKEARTATEQLAKATKDAGGKAEKSGNAWDTVKQKVGGFKDSLSSAAGTVGSFVATAAGTVGAAAVWSDAWSDAMSLKKGTGALSAALGLTEEQSERAGEVAGALYADSYGESIGDVSSAVESVMSTFKGMKDATTADLQDVTAQALSLATAFNVDVDEATRSAAQLINQGLAPDATAAFDQITASLQQVPKALRGEVLDATHEYSQFFGQLGLDGAEAMGLLTKAAEDGQYGIDKMGDSLKEFTIRTADMSTASKDAYETMGFDAEEMANRLLAGGDTAREAFGQIVEGLQGIQDPATQANTAIALFGTPLEDMNVGEIPDFLSSLSSMDSALGDVTGKAAELDQAMAENVDPIDSVKRSLMGMLAEALEPLVQPLADFSAWAREHPTLMQGVAIAFGVLSVAIGAAAVAWAAMTLAASPWLLIAGVIAAAIAAAVAIIVVVIQNWGDIIDWLGEKWEALKGWFVDGWAWINEKVFAPMGKAWDKVGKGFDWVVQKLILPAWEATKSGLKSGWNWINDNVFAPIKSGFNKVGDTFDWVKTNLILPAWSGVKDGLKKTWDWVNDRVFDPMKTGVDNVGKAFDKTKDFIGKAWGKIKEAAAKPVNFILETVYTKGIKNPWEKIADKVGLNLRLPSVRPIKFAEGGVLPGYTPGRDVHRFVSPTGGVLDLSGGEAIMRPEFTQAVGGKAGVDRLNALARQGLVDLQAFAGGGVWDRVKSGAKSAWNWSKEKAGQAWDWSKNTAESVANFVSDPVSAIAELIGKPVRDMLGKIAPGFTGDILAEVPPKFLDNLGTWAKNALTGRAADGYPGGTPGGGAGMGYKAMVEILKNQFPGIAITSTYRPGAVTAGYGNTSYHAMGRAVDMSPRMDVFNWLSRAFPNSAELLYSPAGARQILRGGRRGNTSGVTRANHFNHVHWAMANGGVLPLDLNFGEYDTGGVLPPGDTLVSNNTGKPELILNPQQIAALGQPRGPLDLSSRSIDKMAQKIAEALGLVGDTVRDVRQAIDGALTAERMA